MAGKGRKFRIVIEVLSLAALLWALYPLLNYSELPERIPTHFNIHGEIDGWSAKSSLVKLAVFTFITYVGLTLMAKIPETLNYPVKLTDNNREQLLRLGVMEIVVTKLTILVIFGYLTNISVSITAGNGEFSSYIPLGIILALFIFFAVLVIKMIKLRDK